MQTPDGFQQGYNAEAAVATDSVFTVGQEVAASPTDAQRLVPMLDTVKETAGQDPAQLSADSGYASEGNLLCKARGRMRAKLATTAGRAIYAQRKRSVELVLARSRPAGASGSSCCAVWRRQGTATLRVDQALYCPRRYCRRRISHPAGAWGPAAAGPRNHHAAPSVA
jgi:hypothetical protein